MSITGLLKNKKSLAHKNSIFDGRIFYVLISKKHLKSLGNLYLIYGPIITAANFTLAFDVLFLLNCFIKADPPKTISIETSQAV